jgi:phosphate transport system permease protein
MAISATRIATRRISNTIFTIACVGLTGVALFFLAAILWSLISQGIGGVNLSVFTQDIPTAGSTGGGLRNAIVGSVLMGAEAMIIAIFIGVFAGTWLSEYAGQSRYGSIIRFLNDVLLSAPSILIGLFVWEVFVHHIVGHFSGFAGGVALALLA